MRQLKGTELRDKTLEKWLRKRRESDFEDLKVNYSVRYRALKEFLVKEVHPLVSVGVAVKDGIFLNDHGPNHVATVINRATRLMNTETCTATAYEIYILLTAIQLHDVGNILGRSGHEARLAEFEGQLDGLLGDDSVEKRTIREIAQAHGGKRNGDSDTIQYLLEQPVLNQLVRARFLAAILRLADELADDSQRASKFALKLSAVPEASRLFHKYSASLQSVTIDHTGRAIKLYFEMTMADAEDQFTTAKQYLIEEILRRTLKMHRERLYCMRFLQPWVRLDSINVIIDIFESSRSEVKLDTIGYRLEQRGYPEEPTGGIYDVCPELNDWFAGGRLTGASLIAKLRGIGR